MNYTSIEQSKKLLELGLSPESADMEYWFLKINGSKIGNVPFIKEPYYEKPDCCYNLVPCWSVGALLSMIPSPTLARIDNEDEHFWYCNTIQFGKNHFEYDSSYHDNMVEACIETITWLFEHNHIQKEGEE